MRTPGTPAPLESSKVPERCAAGGSDWACEEKLTANAKKARKTARRRVELIFILRSLTRGSLKVGLATSASRGLRTSPVSWLGGGIWPRLGARARAFRAHDALFLCAP